ncbi:MAG: UDP-N-acetylmuramoyl-tripeptide--D-alanyl-D-alanine ligase [Muribaculaceae bacterium]|nr:UDP-N-acetylmuramoyl-tripeptide--D-alanyl-D-alanine ligase [Muribaculaceae bacterium]
MPTVYTSTVYIVAGLTALFFWIPAIFMTLKRDLMMFQQNSYRPERYSRWASQTGESTTVARCFYLFATAFLLVPMIPFIISAPVAALIAIWFTLSLLKAKYKKPLVFTPRAKRLMGVALTLAAVIVAIAWLLAGLKGACVVAYALLFLSQFVLLSSYTILIPVEKSINKKYYDDAASILKAMPELKIIGITGSYGKTSTKHYLQRILSEKYETLMTPGSYNTTLGVVRTIREYLKPYTEVFIVEMGAKQPGDIKEICDLVHPQDAIITAVGEQHLETFKTIETVQRTKFELFDSLPSNGIAVINNDFAMIASRPTNNGPETIRYAITDTTGCDVTAKDIEYDRRGSSFTYVGPAGEIRFRTPLVGQCNISNLLAAISMALKLDVPIEKIKYAVETMEQVEHRLNMKHTPGGLTIIDDAFNSNPDGSRMALEVLSHMTGGRRIIITPGMIELGERQEELNNLFGQRIAKSADIAIIVGQYNRDAISEGIKADKSFDTDNLYIADSFTEAQQLLLGLAKPGDTVLYENDLPDTFK